MNEDIVVEDKNTILTGQPMYYEYTKAADIEMAEIKPVVFKGEGHGIITLDLAKALKTPYPATSPDLLVNFVNLDKGDVINCEAQASSHVLVVVSGDITISHQSITQQMSQWDCMTFPGIETITIKAHSAARLYWVNDEPLLHYLGAIPQRPTFKPTYYSYQIIKQKIDEYNHQEGASQRNRHGVLLGNEACPFTKTLTPTLWSLFNLTPPKTTQKPHRHNSVAMDLCLYAPPTEKGAVYTLMSKTLDEAGQHVDPVRIDWSSGNAFVTPPGWWHSHVNETDEAAIVYPVQDAGLHTYLRTLFISFT